MFLSLDVTVAQDWWREHYPYIVWEFGKTPDLVLEIVSDTEGGEDTRETAQIYVDAGPVLCDLRSPTPGHG